MNKALFLIVTVLTIACNSNYSEPQSLRSSFLDKYEIPLSVEYKSSIPIRDTTAARDLGLNLFHMPTQVSKVKCVDCHKAENSFFGPEPLTMGGGKSRLIYQETIGKYIDDRDSLLTGMPIDNPKVKSRTSLGLALNGDRVLSAGFLTENPGEFQFGKAENAHFMDDLTLACQHDYILNILANEAFGRPIDRNVVASALSIYQQSLLPNQNKISQFLRGEITSFRGNAELFDQLCYNCHFTNKMDKSFSIQMDSVLVPRLLNIKDSPCFFTDCEEITLYQAIKAHGDGSRGFQFVRELKQSEIYGLRTFMTSALHDDDLLRYDEISE